MCHSVYKLAFGWDFSRVMPQEKHSRGHTSGRKHKRCQMHESLHERSAQTHAYVWSHVFPIKRHSTLMHTHTQLFTVCLCLREIHHPAMSYFKIASKASFIKYIVFYQMHSHATTKEVKDKKKMMFPNNNAL